MKQFLFFFYSFWALNCFAHSENTDHEFLRCKLALKESIKSSKTSAIFMALPYEEFYKDREEIQKILQNNDAYTFDALEASQHFVAVDYKSRKSFLESFFLNPDNLALAGKSFVLSTQRMGYSRVRIVFEDHFVDLGYTNSNRIWAKTNTGKYYVIESYNDDVTLEKIRELIRL